MLHPVAFLTAGTPAAVLLTVFIMTQRRMAGKSLNGQFLQIAVELISDDLGEEME